ncbi:MAG: Smr/MutS family protein [Candidatus Fermentibacteria bacterium]
MTSSHERLEFRKILEDIALRTGSRMGSEKVMFLTPAFRREEASELRSETEAASALLDKDIRVPAGGNDDLHDICSLLDNGAIVLDPQHLRTVGSILAGMNRFLESADSEGSSAADHSALDKYLERIPRLSKLSDRLISITTPDGELSPNASGELSRLLKQVDRLKRTLSKRIARISTSLSGRKLLRDSPPTLRDGRYVLPVISSRKSDVRGIVHDRSESGETIFIEPSELVEDGNAMREALLDLDFEKRKILKEASFEVREHLGSLKECLEASVSLDAVFARALYHRDYGTVFPPEGRLSLRNLRHPLIPGNEVVPNTVELPPEWRVLIVSGPNAGGKSVLLKAVGLAAVMAQSGIGSCVDVDSSIPFFGRVYVSIGDQQSIAHHQSTYSARLLEQLEMLRTPGERSLALIDEPAAGTDPLTGAALAASVLEHLAESGCRVIVTTHQGQLKSFAHGKPGFFNGCMNFREDSLVPDYTFVEGIPGSSFTLEIARRMSFPDSILARAQELSGDSFRLDRMLEEITSARKEVLLQLEELGREREEGRKSLERNEAELSRTRNDLLLQKQKIEKDYIELEHSVNSKADSLLARLARSESPFDRKKLRSQIREVSTISHDQRDTSVTDSKPVPGDIEPGDWVNVKGWSGCGKVEETGRDQATVILGNLKLRKPLCDLEKIRPPEEKPSAGGWSIPITAETELDLRGLSAEEALAELDRAVDDGIVAGIPFINVIHGKGKGILMKAVIDTVRADRRIASFRQGKPSEGGTGVTIVFLNISGNASV